MKTSWQTSRIAAVPDARGLRIPERSLELLRDLVAAHAGIHFDDSRLDILSDRLAPLAIERGLDSMLDYYYLLKYDAAAATEWPRLMDALSVQETYFWREADHFRALASVIVPRLLERRPPRIRVWSIPCATGEEPLSIAMALEESGAFNLAPIEIHASDASTAALERARRGTFGRRSFRQLPDPMRERFFTQTTGRDEWTVRPELLSRITSWSRVNIVNPAETSFLAGCDVIFCRNLFIYFTPSTVKDVAMMFARHLPSPGFLCVGAAESLLRSGAGFDLQEMGGAYVYVKA